MQLPVFLARRPDEPLDLELKAFYERLLTALARPRLPRRASGSSASRSGWDGNDTWQNLVAWGWRGESRRLVVVNLGDAPASGHVSLPWDDLRGQAWQLDDASTGERYERSGDDLRDGLYVALDPWAWHLFDLTPLAPRRTDPMPTPTERPPTAEHARLAEATGRAEDDLFSANPWYEWGPYLSERAWGTVREDYSESGDAWDSFPHDHARSRAYRWNEDGMAGISDIRHELCLALALWNGKDPILKERMFGLTGPQGNHGEDVKEYWWYLEGLPSHALLRWRYHYPQAAFPYDAAREPRPRPARPRARAARHRRLRRRPLLVGRRHLREGLADRGAGADRDREPRRRTRRRSTCCRRSGSGTRGRGATAPSARGSSATARPSSSPTTRSPATGSRARPAPTARRPRRCSARTRRTPPRLFGSEPTTPYPEGRDQRPRRLGRGHGQPGGLRHEGRAPLPRDGAGRRQGRAAAAAAPAGGREPPNAAGTGGWSGAAFDKVVAAREADADEFYARARARRHDAGGDAGPPPGVRRARLEQADVPLQRAPLARRRPGRAAAARGAPARPQQRLAAPRRVRRARDAGPVGVPVVRRLGPRLPRGRLGAPRSRVREVPAPRAAARVVPAPERRAPRLRVELRRRQPAGARDGRAPRVPHRRRPRPRVPRARSSRSC